MSFDPLPAAAALHRIRIERGIVAALPAGIAPGTEDEGAAVQHALARLFEADPPRGFKIGATGRRMQEYLRVDAPIAGFMPANTVHQGHPTLRYGDYIRPGVECEVAVSLRADLPPGPCSLEQALEAVGAFFAGIELVENRYTDALALGAPMLLADQMYHAAAVVGAPGDQDWHELDLTALRGSITLSDGSGDTGITSDLLGHPLKGLAMLAASPLAAAFGGLRAGQVIMLGSVTPPIWLTGPTTVKVQFPPLPTVTLRLT